MGQNKFYEKLLKLDPLSKGKIKPYRYSTDLSELMKLKSLQRNLLHEWFKNTKSNFMEDDFFKIYIDYPRQELIERINVRTSKMIENGAIKEVKDFIKLRVKKDKSACTRPLELMKLQNI